MCIGGWTIGLGNKLEVTRQVDVLDWTTYMIVFVEKCSEQHGGGIPVGSLGPTHHEGVNSRSILHTMVCSRVLQCT